MLEYERKPTLMTNYEHVFNSYHKIFETLREHLQIYKKNLTEFATQELAEFEVIACLLNKTKIHEQNFEYSGISSKLFWTCFTDFRQTFVLFLLCAASNNMFWIFGASGILLAFVGAREIMTKSGQEQNVTYEEVV